MRDGVKHIPAQYQEYEEVVKKKKKLSLDVYITSDGQKFGNESDADSHQKKINFWGDYKVLPLSDELRCVLERLFGSDDIHLVKLVEFSTSPTEPNGFVDQYKLHFGTKIKFDQKNLQPGKYVIIYRYWSTGDYGCGYDEDLYLWHVNDIKNNVTRLQHLVNTEL